jgi:hypothetical protein
MPRLVQGGKVPTSARIYRTSRRTVQSVAIMQLFADISKRNKFLLFVRDNQNQRLRSYVFDLPE